ncbi:MAG: DUF1330 domain-containing protein [Acidobacteria bacterium]|nr:DUF1330 domain-containing protein [Acidobacteriota bacterium]
MAVYVIASYDITDAEAYAGYVPAVMPLISKYNAEVIVADYDAQPLEGQKRGVYVVLKFASEEDALAWYRDPEYEKPKHLRMSASANTNLVIAKEFVLP